MVERAFEGPGTGPPAWLRPHPPPPDATPTSSRSAEIPASPASSAVTEPSDRPSERPPSMHHHRWEHVDEAARVVRDRWPRRLADRRDRPGDRPRRPRQEIVAEAVLPYPEIPPFSRIRTVESHRGTVGLRGRSPADSVMAMEGRFHLYEGYTAAQVTFPDPGDEGELGCQTLIVSNAAGRDEPHALQGGTSSSSTTTSTCSA